MKSTFEFSSGDVVDIKYLITVSPCYREIQWVATGGQMVFYLFLAHQLAKEKTKIYLSFPDDGMAKEKANEERQKLINAWDAYRDYERGVINR